MIEIHKDDDTKQKLELGILYSNKQLAEVVYVLIAKYCLSAFSEKDKVSLSIFNSSKDTYEYITPVKQDILLHPTDDTRIIILNQRKFATIITNIPSTFFLIKTLVSIKL